ncbi:winged helix-turn-helix domain-containing protein [Bradyrhizobium sp. 174]|uniref:winged helix-turn-helix domain-containing tetratricopeptide repeat protein n=1 Tax=Bradyrhizobium sp. 174 TaxID=2782645 RepID=UPI001FF705B8|nr:winged helix-turn-helix domain-containing protein [Bradyrhizobium sp. 174]MCK1576987.1 winged helix-turn-helix domain-containing protein [Bradyrhizobium sp. 174]
MRFSFGPFVLDTMRGTLTRDGCLVPANHKGVALLTALLRTPGEAVGKTELMDAAWLGAAVEESNLSVQIAALRKLLGGRGDGGEWIATVPRVGYRFAGSLSGSNGSCLGSGQEVRPLIAVLPFGIASDEMGKEYLAHGITDDIITALVRYRWFRVVLRGLALSQGEGPMDSASAATNSSGVHYALHGNVRLATQRLRISAHLVDAQTGEHLWAERYDLAMADVFAIQDEIAERVVAAIEPELLKSESLLAVTRHSGNVTAWDLVRQGMWHFHKVTREGHRAARELFRDACNIDPELPEAYSWLGRVSAGLIAYGWTDDASADGREGVAAATRAIVLDPRDPYSHYAFAIAHCYAGSANTAVLAAQSAIGINPSFALGHLVLGMALLFDGDARRAIAPLEHGLTLNPNDPQNVAWYVLLAYAQLLANDPCRALDSGNRALAVRPHFRPAFEVQVYSAAALGCLDEAKRWLARMHEVGGPGSYFVVPLRTNNPRYDVRITELTKKAVL